MHSKHLVTALSLALVAETALALPSVPFQVAYGTSTNDDRAQVTLPVANCPEGGTLTVGTSDRPDETSTPYVVRTGVDGTRLWETTYQTGHPTGWIGGAIESRDGSGFVIAGGVVKRGSGFDVWVMKIDCAGKPVWSRAYGGPRSQYANGITEARTGNPANGTRAGDLIVAGVHDAGDFPHEEGLLLRVSANGRLIWQRSYVNPSSAEFLNTVIEASPRAGSPTGDIVAAGIVAVSDDDMSNRGYAIRVNGDTGKIDAHSDAHGAVYYWGNNEADVELHGIAELPSRELVFVGTTGLQQNHAYVVRTGVRPADVRLQTRVGDAETRNLALDVELVQHPLSIAKPGQLLLAGATVKPNSAAEAFVIAYDPTTLTPISGSGRRYGRGALAQSVAPLPSGLVIGGTHVTVGSDLYDYFIVNTDGEGRTGCEKNWEPASLPARVTPIPKDTRPRDLDLTTYEPKVVMKQIVHAPRNTCLTR